MLLMNRRATLELSKTTKLSGRNMLYDATVFPRIGGCPLFIGWFAREIHGTVSHLTEQEQETGITHLLVLSNLNSLQ